jgi:cytochrome c oxidase subunit 2
MDTPRTSTLVPPTGRWWWPLGKDERMWFIVVSAWAISMFVMMLFVWPAIGNEQTTFESMVVDPEVFEAEAQAYAAAHTVDTISGVPVVEPPPDQDVFLLARQFQFSPILRLRRNQSYRLLLSSSDVQHGLSIQPPNINIQVVPGYITVIELTPEEAGEYQIICNEFCGMGHHLMLGRIEVVE